MLRVWTHSCLTDPKCSEFDPHTLSTVKHIVSKGQRRKVFQPAEALFVEN